LIAAGGLACTMLAAGVAQALPVTDSFFLNGLVNNSGSTINLSDLQSFSPVTQTVTYQAGGTPVNQDFTGVPLWNFLNDAGVNGGGGLNPLTPPPSTPTQNQVNRMYVVTTGSDGYRAVTSIGEINPNFGNTPSLVAYQQANPPGSTPTDLGNDGFARTTAPVDIRGGRYVSNIARMDVFDAQAQSQVSGIGGGISQSFALAGQIVNPRAFNLTDLQALPQTTIVTDGGRTFTGVSLWSLLTGSAAGGGIMTDPNVKNDILGKIVVATGSDGYKQIFSLGEFDPNFGAEGILVAIDESGGGLGTAGFARMVAPGDVRAGRWVSNLIGLEVLDAPLTPVPAPAALLLFATGLGGVVLRRFRHQLA
jgi:hypothetical protein